MTLAFAWHEGRPVRHFDGRHAFIAAPLDRPATYIVIEHEDFRGGRLLQELYPARSRPRLSSIARQGLRPRLPGGCGCTSRPPAANLRPPAAGPASRWSAMTWTAPTSARRDRLPPALVAGDGTVRTDWTVFTHLLGRPRPTAACLGGTGCTPRPGQRPTTTWAPGDLILDEYQLQLPVDAPPGDIQSRWACTIRLPAARGRSRPTDGPGPPDFGDGAGAMTTTKIIAGRAVRRLARGPTRLDWLLLALILAIAELFFASGR